MKRTQQHTRGPINPYTIGECTKRIQGQGTVVEVLVGMNALGKIPGWSCIVDLHEHVAAQIEISHGVPWVTLNDTPSVASELVGRYSEKYRKLHSQIAITEEIVIRKQRI